MKKLNEHDEQLEVIARTVTGNTKRLDSVESKLDKVADIVLDNRDRLDRVEQNMVTKKDHSEMMGTLDEIVHLVKKRDEETTFMGEQVKRNTEAIEEIKPLVGLKVTT